MTRLVALTANDPDRMPCALHALRDALRVPTSFGEADGWGVGYYEDERALLIRRPGSPLKDKTLFDMANVKSKLVLAHVRKATVGKVDPVNTHPFRFRRWLFAHAGTLANPGQIKPRLWETIPEFIRRDLHGDTDSETAFGVFLAEVHRVDRLDDAFVEASVVGGLLVRTIEIIEECARGSGLAAADLVAQTLNFVATNGRIVVASRRGLSLHYSLLEGIGACALCKLAPSVHNYHALLESHRRFRGVVLAYALEPEALRPKASPDSAGPGGRGGAGRAAPAVHANWQEVPEGRVLTVDRRLQATVV